MKMFFDKFFASLWWLAYAKKRTKPTDVIKQYQSTKKQEQIPFDWSKYPEVVSSYNEETHGNTKEFKEKILQLRRIG